MLFLTFSYFPNLKKYYICSASIRTTCKACRRTTSNFGSFLLSFASFFLASFLK